MVHHFNCASMCPFGGALLGGTGPPWHAHGIVAHCLLVEGADGLVLCETGFGTDDVADPARLGLPFRAFVRPRPARAETAIERIRALGLDPADVRHIVVTHLDVDHAGGLGDFPDAEVHVHESEHAAAMNPSLRERERYREPQWAHGPRWKLHGPGGDRWHGLESVRVLPGVEPEIVLVPLAGHSRGHSAIAIRNGDGWLMHCGDAYFHHGEVRTPPDCPPGLRVFQNAVGLDRRQRLANQERLRELRRDHRHEIDMFCAHDPHDLARFA